MEVLLRLFALLLPKLAPRVLILLQGLVILDLLQGKQPIEQQAVCVVDQEIAECIEVHRIVSAELHESFTVRFILPNVLHQVRGRESILELAVVVYLLGVDVDDEEGVHQVLLEGVVDEEDVLVEAVLLLVVLADVLLGHQVEREVDEVDAHVWVADAAVQHDRDRADELHLEIGVGSKVDFCLDLLEQLRVVGEILHEELRQGQEIHWQWLTRRLNATGPHSLLHESEEILEGVGRDLHAIARTNQESIGEREELSVELDRALAEDVCVHAKPGRHLLVEHLPVLGFDGFVDRVVVPVIKLLELLSLEADENVDHKEAFCHEVWWS